MIKFLFKNFKNFPVIGNSIKVAYVEYLVKNLVKKTEQQDIREAKGESKRVTGNETEDFVNSTANDLFDEAIVPILTENNISEVLIKPVKEKAIDKLSGVIRKKFINIFENY